MTPALTLGLDFCSTPIFDFFKLQNFNFDFEFAILVILLSIFIRLSWASAAEGVAPHGFSYIILIK